MQCILVQERPSYRAVHGHLGAVHEAGGAEFELLAFKLHLDNLVTQAVPTKQYEECHTTQARCLVAN